MEKSLLECQEMLDLALGSHEAGVFNYKELYSLLQCLIIQVDQHKKNESKEIHAGTAPAMTIGASKIAETLSVGQNLNMNSEDEYSNEPKTILSSTTIEIKAGTVQANALKASTTAETLSVDQILQAITTKASTTTETLSVDDNLQVTTTKASTTAEMLSVDQNLQVMTAKASTSAITLNSYQNVQATTIKASTSAETLIIGQNLQFSATAETLSVDQNLQAMTTKISTAETLNIGQNLQVTTTNVSKTAETVNVDQNLQAITTQASKSAETLNIHLNLNLKSKESSNTIISTDQSTTTSYQQKHDSTILQIYGKQSGRNSTKKEISIQEIVIQAIDNDVSNSGSLESNQFEQQVKNAIHTNKLDDKGLNPEPDSLIIDTSKNIPETEDLRDSQLKKKIVCLYKSESFPDNKSILSNDTTEASTTSIKQSSLSTTRISKLNPQFLAPNRNSRYNRSSNNAINPRESSYQQFLDDSKESLPKVHELTNDEASNARSVSFCEDIEYDSNRSAPETMDNSSTVITLRKSNKSLDINKAKRLETDHERLAREDSCEPNTSESTTSDRNDSESINTEEIPEEVAEFIASTKTLKASSNDTPSSWYNQKKHYGMIRNRNPRNKDDSDCIMQILYEKESHTDVETKETILDYVIKNFRKTMNDDLKEIELKLITRDAKLKRKIYERLFPLEDKHQAMTDKFKGLNDSVEDLLDGFERFQKCTNEMLHLRDRLNDDNRHVKEKVSLMGNDCANLKEKVIRIDLTMAEKDMVHSLQESKADKDYADTKVSYKKFDAIRHDLSNQIVKCTEKFIDIQDDVKRFTRHFETILLNKLDTTEIESLRRDYTKKFRKIETKLEALQQLKDPEFSFVGRNHSKSHTITKSFKTNITSHGLPRKTSLGSVRLCGGQHTKIQPEERIPRKTNIFPNDVEPCPRIYKPSVIEGKDGILYRGTREEPK